MEDAIICPACGFDPYDMIIYAAKQEFPDRNPRDVIEEMYKSGDYDDEADFYVFENHPEFCPNQELLMDYIQMKSEEEAYAYAYNEGHSGSRKNEPYKPNPTTKEGANFKKIYKQRAETFEADWRDLPRDSAGRWTRSTSEEPENLDAYIDIQPAQSGTFPLPVEKEEPSLNTTNDYITIRDLASMMNKMTGGMLGFAESRNTVLEMLGDNDSMERRDSLYFTIEDTILTMENYNETGYEGDIQVMVDIMRDTGIAPPANFEEKVMARYQFEDKYAAEDKKILKPEVPADYNIQQTFGNNMILTAEGLEEDRNSPAFEKWEEKFYLCYHDWQDDELHVDTFDEKYQITAYCSLCDATMLLHIGDNGPEVVELPGRRPLLDFYDTSQEAYAAEDDEGPTINDFFRELSKLLKKYGSIETFDSERVKEGLYFSGMILPHNGAYNFFQYEEGFGSIYWRERNL
jgi:hypothetical protein